MQDGKFNEAVATIMGILVAIVVVLLLFVTTKCIAAEEPAWKPTVVGLHVVSYHFEDGKQAADSLGWNNYNYGLYARWDNGVTAGFYKNSLFRWSVYAGYTLESAPFASLLGAKLGLTVGMVSGYDRVVDSAHPGARLEYRCESACVWTPVKSTILPMVVPSVALPIGERLSVRAALVYQPQQPVAAHFTVETRF